MAHARCYFFEISVRPDTVPVILRPDRIFPKVAKEVDAVLEQYFAAGLIQHSTSPYPSPLVVVPKKNGGIRITVNSKTFNNVSVLDQLPIPRVDKLLDSWGKGKIFSLCGLVLPSNHRTRKHDPTYNVLHTNTTF